MRRSSSNQTGKSYKKNLQFLSKCLMCIKLAVGTLKLSEIEQETFDEISISKILKRFVYQSNENLLTRREKFSDICYKIL